MSLAPNEFATMRSGMGQSHLGDGIEFEPGHRGLVRAAVGGQGQRAWDPVDQANPGLAGFGGKQRGLLQIGLGRAGTGRCGSHGSGCALRNRWNWATVTSFVLRA